MELFGVLLQQLEHIEAIARLPQGVFDACIGMMIDNHASFYRERSQREIIGDIAVLNAMVESESPLADNPLYPEDD